jgi:bis(5'-nucleosyl)-tetraphosphatase (symmetrical)
MAMYLIGDVQGCDQALQNLLDKIQFSPSKDTLYLLGDLVNRGPDNTAVLRRLEKLGNSARCLLGNHDLHLLAMHLGLSRPKPGDTVDDVLQATDRQQMMDWLRHQSLAMCEAGILMVHAGVLPQWTVHQTMALAAEVESVLQSHAWPEFMQHMYGNQPVSWKDSLSGHERLRVIVNGLTRLRFCSAQGDMEFAHHGDVNAAPSGYMPWFDVPDRQTRDSTVAFGHWSSLSALERDDVIELDTGCVWGRCLTALKIDPVSGAREKIHVSCSEAALSS